MTTLYKRYKAELREGIDWEALKAELESMKDNSGYVREDESGIKAVETFMGTVFALTPSGKYYMPWACSNVTAREAYRDEQWHAALEALCSERGLYVTSGDGDPCDLYIGMTYES